MHGLVLEDHSCASVVLEALDAVGVHLIVVGVVVMDDALEVAALPHLLLHMHSRLCWFKITCRGDNNNKK